MNSTVAEAEYKNELKWKKSLVKKNIEVKKFQKF